MPVAARLTEDELYSAITKLFDEACESHQLQVLVRAADRHGSIVWEAGPQPEQGEIGHVVTLAVTNITESERRPRYLVEVWVAAMGSGEYRRNLADRLILTDRASDLPRLTHMIEYATEVVSLLTESSGHMLETDAGDLPSLRLDARAQAEDLAMLRAGPDTNVSIQEMDSHREPGVARDSGAKPPASRRTPDKPIRSTG